MHNTQSQPLAAPPLSLTAAHRASQRILGLDGLRALAVIAVVWHHSHPGYSSFPVSHNGFLGVDVFFVLSGFLITTLLLEEKRATGTVSLVSFYVRRSLRIFPFYYAVLILMAIFFSVSAKSSNARVFLNELPWHASYLSNWVSLKSMMAITWSLSTEEQFYLVWPPLFVWLGARALWPLLVFLAINQGVNFGFFDKLLFRSGYSVESLSILQITFTPILLGVVLAFGLQHSATQNFKTNMHPWALPIAVCIALLLANTSGDIRGWPRMLFHLAISCVVALVVLSPKSLLVRALEWRPLVHVGKISYGIYLFHMLTLFAVQSFPFRSKETSTNELNFILVLILSTACATLSYKCFERPLMRYGR